MSLDGIPARDSRCGPGNLAAHSPRGRLVRLGLKRGFLRVSEDIEVVWWCLVAFWAPFGVPKVPTEPRDQKDIFAKKPVFSWPMVRWAENGFLVKIAFWSLGSVGT